MNVAKFVNVRNLPVLINVVTISEEVEDPIHAHLESDFICHICEKCKIWGTHLSWFQGA